MVLTTANTTTTTNNNTFSYLDQARQLPLPSREAMLRRDHSVSYFWYRFGSIFEKAWKEWAESKEAATLKPLHESHLLDSKLRHAIEAAWENPTKEDAIFDLAEEVSPGVYKIQFFNPNKLQTLREYLDLASKAQIPTRPPYGIVLNRGGFMVDPRSEGYLAIPAFQEFYRTLMDRYMRPLGRLFFPQFINGNDDSQTFAFTIQYQAGTDRSIREHSDSSALTLNINLNLPGEEYSGSSLYFVDPLTGQKNIVNFEPGVAIMHRGATPHAAMPIESGERSNLVLWLYGEEGHVNFWPYNPEEQLTREQRWTPPAGGSWAAKDDWTPF